MNRRTFMMGLFGIAGTAVCAGKAIAGDAVSVPFRKEGDFEPAEFQGFGTRLNEALKNIEETETRLTAKLKRSLGDAR